MIGKIILYSIAILSLCGSIILRYSDEPFSGKYDESKYLSGSGHTFRNQTVDEFGIRRFEILRLTGDIEKDVKRWSLYDNQILDTIECDVYSYIEIYPFVYAVGDEGYTKLNYETAEVLQFKNLDKFDPENQLIFQSLEKGEIGKKNEQRRKWNDQNR